MCVYCNIIMNTYVYTNIIVILYFDLFPTFSDTKIDLLFLYLSLWHVMSTYQYALFLLVMIVPRITFSSRQYLVIRVNFLIYNSRWLTLVVALSRPLLIFDLRGYIDEICFANLYNFCKVDIIYCFMIMEDIYCNSIG